MGNRILTISRFHRKIGPPSKGQEDQLRHKEKVEAIQKICRI